MVPAGIELMPMGLVGEVGPMGCKRDRIVSIMVLCLSFFPFLRSTFFIL